MARQRAELIKEIESLIEDSVSRIGNQYQIVIDTLSLEEESPHETYLLLNVLESVLATIKRETPSRAQALRGVRIYLDAETTSNSIDLENVRECRLQLHRSCECVQC